MQLPIAETSNRRIEIATSTATEDGQAGGNGETHYYGNNGNTNINLAFDTQDGCQRGHHVRGGTAEGGSGGVDTFDFTNIHTVNCITIGRIEDLAAEDHVKIQGQTLNLQSESGSVNGYAWKVVEFDISEV